MALSVTRDLSLIDFIGMEGGMNMPDGEEGINVFAFVCEFSASRVKEVESALKKREEAKAAEDRIKLCRLPPLIPNKKMTAKKKAKCPTEDPLPHPAESSSSMRPRKRRTPNLYLDEIRSSNSIKRASAASASGVAGTTDLLALQVIDMEEPNLKRKKKKADDVAEKPKKKPRVTAAPAETGPDPPPGLPESFRERIRNLGGRNLVLVIQKRLFNTDVAKQQNRLSIPQSALKTEFLKDHERATLDSRLADGHCEALKPKILDATGEDRTISLRKWEMKKDNGCASTITYNLNKPWYDMVKANGWEAGDLIQLWAFRVEEELGLAIVKLEEN